MTATFSFCLSYYLARDRPLKGCSGADTNITGGVCDQDKSVPVELGGLRIHRPGTLIGKALEPLAQGTGEILVLLSLQ